MGGRAWCGHGSCHPRRTCAPQLGLWGGVLRGFGDHYVDRAGTGWPRTRLPWADADASTRRRVHAGLGAQHLIVCGPDAQPRRVRWGLVDLRWLACAVGGDSRSRNRFAAAPAEETAL